MATERSDDQFDLVFAPARYGALNAETEGRWTALAASDGTPLGVAWADGENAAGFLQANPSDAAEDVWQDFAISASLKVPALSAYQMALHKKGVVAEQEQRGKLADVYKYFSQMIDRQSAVTAALEDAAAASPDALPTDSHIYITVADEDENRVLELVRNDETGLYIRDNGEWLQIDADADNDRVWDRIIIDVTPEAAAVYDAAAAAGEVTADQFNEVLAPEEVQQ